MPLDLSLANEPVSCCLLAEGNVTLRSETQCSEPSIMYSRMVRSSLLSREDTAIRGPSTLWSWCGKVESRSQLSDVGIILQPLDIPAGGEVPLGTPGKSFSPSLL